jgi:hypothetical protein
MRKLWLLLLLAPAAFVYACGGDDTTDGGSDAANDNTTKPDSGGDAAGDSAVNDAAKDTGPTDSGGGDVVVSITCQHPSDCFDGGAADAAYPPDSGEVCCAVAVTTGQVPNCSLSSLTTSCKAPGNCASDIPLSQTCGTDTLRGCAHAAECVEAQYNKCCVFDVGDAAVQACLNAIAIQVTGAKCLDAGQ